MNTILKYFAIALFALPLGVKAQCDLPSQYEGNTGTNMTVMLASSFIGSISVSNENSYLVAFSESGMVVGSACIAFDCLLGGQTSISIWGNDSFTDETDGALSGENISFQLVDGSILYDVVPMFQVGSNQFVANGISFIVGSTQTLVCEGEFTGIMGCMDETAFNYNADATDDDGSCEYVSNSPEAFQWTQLIESTNLPDGLNKSSYGFDRLNRLVYFVNDNTNELQVYSIDDNEFYKLNVNSWPSFDRSGDFIYHPEKNVIQVFRSGTDDVYQVVPSENSTWELVIDGSHTSNMYGSDPFYNGNTGNIGVMNGYGWYAVRNWVFEGVDDTWTKMIPNTNSEPYKRGTGFLYPNEDFTKLYMIDGQGSQNGDQWANSCSLGASWATDVGVYCWLKDVWELNLETYEWSNILPVNSNSINYIGTNAYDYVNNTLYRFGGYIPSASYQGAIETTADAYKFQIGVDTEYTQISQSGDIPPETSEAGVSYFDEQENQLLIFRTDGVWKFSLGIPMDTLAGCQDSIACNYNVETTTDDGSCEYAEQYYNCDGVCLNDTDSDGVCDELEVNGCTDEIAYNFNEIATDDDNSCYPIIYGCTDLLAFNFNDYDFDGESNQLTGIDGVDVNTDDGSCIEIIEGCMEDWADNYNISANTSDDSCYKMGCMSGWADNYDELATQDDGTCYLNGCTHDWADNYDVNATIDDASCYRYGCTQDWAENFDELATTDDQTCFLNGCTSEWADNFDLNATIDDGSCFKNGCIDSNADNFDVFATTDDASCLYTGCTTESACNYADYFNVHDVSLCDFPEQYYDCNGVCESDADNDDVCDELEVSGCQQANANNYNPLATDAAFCMYYGCMEADADNYDPNANTMDNSCYYLGCMNADALNFDTSATLHEESQCVYNVADFGCELPDEYSGLITGSNMNILLTDQFTEQITIVNPDAYIVGVTASDLIIGSAPISQGEMTSITLWGDDVQTDEIDGAISWESISLFVVDGTNLYNISLADNINYSDNRTMILFELNEVQTICLSGYYTQIPIFGCLDPIASNYIEPIGDAGVDVNTEDGTCLYREQLNCVLPEVYDDNITGNNMNILFTQDFMNSLPNLQEGAYIVAVNNENTTFGSVAVFGTTMISLTIWGDDTGTISVDGALEGEELHLYLVNGSNLYDINPYESNTYTNNGMQIFEQTASVLSLCSNGIIVHLEGCVDESASNYNPSATDDDGSCTYEGCTYSVFYEFSEQVSIDDGTCETLIVYGCTDSLYVEFNPRATENDGSCIYTIERIQELELTEASYETIVLAYALLEQNVAPIPVDLYMGWNIIGYNLNYPQNTAACFNPIAENIVLAKNNGGYIYWPAFGFNGIGDLIPGQGYQILIKNEVNDFSFVDVGEMRVELSPTVPQWAVDMATIHPNDIKTLVRVVNMLGQEVNIESQNSGTTLLYLYNDGSVTKKILP